MPDPTLFPSSRYLLPAPKCAGLLMAPPTPQPFTFTSDRLDRLAAPQRAKFDAAALDLLTLAVRVLSGESSPGDLYLAGLKFQEALTSDMEIIIPSFTTQPKPKSKIDVDAWNADLKENWDRLLELRERLGKGRSTHAAD
jgi:hypothetical protein